MKKSIFFLTILCMVEPDARCPLFAELTEVLVVQGKLTACESCGDPGAGARPRNDSYVKY